MATRANPFTPGAQYVRPNPETEILTANPAVRFLSQAVQPPSTVYVGLEDSLALSAASNVSGTELVTVSYRLLLAGKGIVEGQITMALAGDRVVRLTQQQLAEGFLLSVTCTAAIATARGQTFARLFLNRGPLVTGHAGRTLMADYITTRQSPGYPEGRILSPSEGPGHITSTSFAAPNLGIEQAFAVPTNALWRIVAMFTNFTASGVAGVRTLNAIIRAGGITCGQFGSLVTVGPLGGLNVAYAPIGAYTPANAALAPVPLPPSSTWSQGVQFSTSTGAFDVNDQYGALNVFIEEWLDNA